MWVDYWELTNRINELQPAEFTAFAQRWRGTYVEDRLRNDWLLELGARRDCATFAAEFPRFRMNDDREVTCFALANDQLAGKDVREAGVAAWLAQKRCRRRLRLLGGDAADAEAAQRRPTIWKKARASIEANRPRAARQAAALVSDSVGSAVGEIVDSPARYLRQERQRRDPHRRRAGDAGAGAPGGERQRAQRPTLLERVAGSAHCPAELGIVRMGERRPAERRSSCSPRPPTSSCAPLASPARAGTKSTASDETLAWKARAALRADNGRARWQQVMQAINAMSAGRAARARPGSTGRRAACRSLARDSQEGEALRRDQPRAAREHRRPAQLLRRARRRGPRPDADAAGPADTADDGRARRPPPPIPGSRAAWR